MPRSDRTTRTMYVHTIDGRPARLIRFTHGRVAMVPATPGVRIVPLTSLGAIRREWNEVLDNAFAESKRDFPLLPREVHFRATSDMLKRLGYVLVEVPDVAR